MVREAIKIKKAGGEAGKGATLFSKTLKRAKMEDSKYILVLNPQVGT